MSYIDAMIKTALRRGVSTRWSHRVVIEGTSIPLETFVGHFPRVQGTITLWYYGIKVLAVDFTRGAITDFGARYPGYWQYALFACFRFTLPEWVHGVYRTWCGSGWERRPEIIDMRERFCRQVPWIRYDNGIRWFLWETYDPQQENLFDKTDEFIASNGNWRYFTYDWDAQGQWTRRFISPDAERLWRQREKRREKQQAKKAA